MKKDSCKPIKPKKYTSYVLKKIHTRNLITKTKSCGSKIPHPPPPHNFSNGPSFIQVFLSHSKTKTQHDLTSQWSDESNKDREQ